MEATPKQNSLNSLTPREIVSELDRYVIGQALAKRAVAIALRNRWRRLNVTNELREEITPKNIIMIGPTGVGKTEIARRLARLAGAPFLKVEASKFTEVGYVGKDVESMIRELTEIGVNQMKVEERERVRVKAEEMAEERLLDILLPQRQQTQAPAVEQAMTEQISPAGPTQPANAEEESTRAKLKQLLRDGKLDERMIEIEPPQRPHPMGFSGAIPMVEVVSAGGSMDEISNNLRDMLGNIFQKNRKPKKAKVREARKLLAEEEAQRLIDMDQVAQKAVDLVENNGIIFIDEIDKIASSGRGSDGGRGGPDVSREGVQRDILPIIEGSTVSTKYGFVKTDHILFIAAGAFHISKPSDLIPELQGRFPIRVELSSLTREDFLRILIEPKNSLTKQYSALMQTEGVTLEFKPDSLDEIASVAAEVNRQMENIGARRLHTILEKVMDELSFTASERADKYFVIDALYVRQCLNDVVKNEDLRKYIL